MESRTNAQIERQTYRDDKGKYSIVNPCEICGKSAGIEYFSHNSCNEWNLGLCICKKCCKKYKKLSDNEWYQLLKEADSKHIINYLKNGEENTAEVKLTSLKIEDIKIFMNENYHATSILKITHRNTGIKIFDIFCD